MCTAAPSLSPEQEGSELSPLTGSAGVKEPPPSPRSLRSSFLITTWISVCVYVCTYANAQAVTLVWRSGGNHGIQFSSFTLWGREIELESS